MAKVELKQPIVAEISELLDGAKAEIGRASCRERV